MALINCTYAGGCGGAFNSIALEGRDPGSVIVIEEILSVKLCRDQLGLLLPELGAGYRKLLSGR